MATKDYIVLADTYTMFSVGRAISDERNDREADECGVYDDPKAAVAKAAAIAREAESCKATYWPGGTKVIEHKVVYVLAFDYDPSKNDSEVIYRKDSLDYVLY